jgi:hypothetical protein
LKATGFFLKDRNFHKLPKAWQQFVHTLAQSEPHVLSADEDVIFDRVSTRLSNWREKERREAVRAYYDDREQNHMSTKQASQAEKK